MYPFVNKRNRNNSLGAPVIATYFVKQKSKFAMKSRILCHGGIILKRLARIDSGDIT
jgi:hypothetical protein